MDKNLGKNCSEVYYKPLSHIFEIWTKNCPFCQNSIIHKHGKINNIQRYKCTACNKTFTFQEKLNPCDIWQDYSQGKQTYKELSIKYQCSVKTIQRYIDKAPKTALNSPISTYLNIIMDTTFFGWEFDVLVLMYSLSKNVIHHQIVSTEKGEYYHLALNRFRNKNYVTQSVTCDGRWGLLKDLLNTSTQMCHFHLVAIVMRKLRKNINLWQKKN